nr:MAG TPA: hypothetical protein [Caudoviricetes sp.]
MPVLSTPSISILLIILIHFLFLCIYLLYNTFITK